MAEIVPIAFPVPETDRHMTLARRGRRAPDSSSVIIDTYLLPNSHGTCRRFCCECCLTLGCMLPLLGPLLGLCVFVPYFDLIFEEGNVIQPNTPCFGPDPGICPASFKFDYFFWNITNAEQWLNGTHPPAFQEVGPYVYNVHEYRYNVAFSATYASVSYTNHNFQVFSQAESCAGCSLSDMFVGVNRAYLAVIKSNGGKEYNLLLPSVVLTLNAIYDNILLAIQQQNGTTSADAKRNLATKQWVECDVLSNVTGKELCARQEFPSGSPSLQSGTELLQQFLGNFSAADAQGSDPAARAAVTAFVQDPPEAQAMQYNITTDQVRAVRQYLEGLVRDVVAPVFQARVLGAFAGPGSGGLVVARTVDQWINGWTDPILAAALGAGTASQVRLAFAWPNATAPMDTFGKSTSQLSHKDDLLIFERNITTGNTAAQDIPQQSLGYAEYPVVEVLRTAPAPDEAIMRGNQSIPVHGADGGLAFGPTPDPQDRQMVFDATFYRPVNTVFTGDWTDVKGIRAMLYGLAPEALASCSASAPSDPAQRCIYPDTLNGTWNVSLTYASDTVITLPHFFRADDVLPESSKFDFSPDADLHSYTFGVDPVTGITVYGMKGFQFVHLVRPTDIFYPHLWTNPDLALGGVWMPSYWVRSRFEPADPVAAAFKFGLLLQSLLRVTWTDAVPILGGVMLLISVWSLLLSRHARKEHAEMRLRRKSRARDPKLKGDELDELAQQAADEGDSPGAWPLVGEKRYSKAWLGPISGLQSGSLPSLSRQGSQLPLLQLDKLQSEGPEVEMIGAGRHDTDDTPGSSLEHVGWGGNLRAMLMHSEEASHLDHPPFRPTLLSKPGTRQVDEGGATLESAIMQRHSTANSSWGVMNDTSHLTSPGLASRMSQGSSSSSSGKASRAASRKYSSIELGTIAEERRASTTGGSKRAASVSWADLRQLATLDEGDSTLDAEAAQLLPRDSVSTGRSRSLGTGPSAAAERDQAAFSDTMQTQISGAPFQRPSSDV